MDIQDEPVALGVAANGGGVSSRQLVSPPRHLFWMELGGNVRGGPGWFPRRGKTLTKFILPPEDGGLWNNGITILDRCMRAIRCCDENLNITRP